MKNPIFSKSCLGWLALWVAFAACERDDTFCNTPHPAEGALLLHTGYAGNYYMKVQDYHTSVPAADFPCRTARCFRNPECSMAMPQP